MLIEKDKGDWSNTKKLNIIFDYFQQIGIHEVAIKTIKS